MSFPSFLGYILYIQIIKPYQPSSNLKQWLKINFLSVFNVCNLIMVENSKHSLLILPLIGLNIDAFVPTLLNKTVELNEG